MSDWFEFLDREDRMTFLMQRAEPIIMNNSPALTWDYFEMLVGSNWYGIWPNPTDQEMWLCKQIAELNLEWADTGSCFTPNSETAVGIKGRFRRLFALSEPRQAQDSPPSNS